VENAYCKAMKTAWLHRANEEEDFMPAFNGVETVIFDADGTTGEVDDYEF